MNKKKLNSTCQDYKDAAIRNFVSMFIALIPLVIAYWSLFHKAKTSDQIYITRLVCFIATIPVIYFLVNGLRSVISLNTYTKYYNPYEEEITHGKDAPKLSKSK